VIGPRCGAALLLLLFTMPCIAQTEARIGHLSVNHAYSHPTPASVGVVYFSITNSGTQPDRLIALSSPIAAQVQMHETHTVQGLMQMRAVSFVECPPGVTVKSEPGGLHVMLIGLSSALKVGTEFALTLQFRDAGILTLHVPVENAQ